METKALISCAVYPGSSSAPLFSPMQKGFLMTQLKLSEHFTCRTLSLENPVLFGARSYMPYTNILYFILKTADHIL